MIGRASLAGVLSLAVALTLSSGAAHAAPTSVVAGPSYGICTDVLSGARNAAPDPQGYTKTIALTFDDGPGRSTAAILAILRRFDVRATFFNVGGSVIWMPQMVRREFADGFLLGDHTETHPVMTGLSARQQMVEINATAHQTFQLTHTWPCVFRPPYGDYDTTTLAVAHHSDMTLWMWSDGTGDWEADGSGSPQWIHNIEVAAISQGRVSDHPVVLMHNQRILMPATVAALPTIIQWFERRGYHFVDLLGRGGPPDSCGVPTASIPPPAATAEDEGWSLASNGRALSPGGQFTLQMQADGALTWSITGGRTLWSSPTAGHPGATADLTGAGRLEVVSNGATLWSSPAGSTGDHLALEADGVLALTAAGVAQWSATAPYSQLRPGDSLESGWYVSSPDLRCRLTQSASGSLRLTTADGQTFWTSGVRGLSGAVTLLQADGNLVTRAGGAAHWESSTGGRPGSLAGPTDTGRVEVTTASGAVLWATP